MASINGMQVKEYIQTLTDENLVRVEKIGSGNWYWCFGSDEKKAREAQLDRVCREVEKVRASYEEVGLRVASQRAKQEEEEQKEEANMGRDGDSEGEGESDKQREDLQRHKQELEKTVQELQTEWNRSCSCSSSTPDSKTAQEKKAELETLRQTAEMWTDNIYILEAYLGKLAGGDREIMAAVQQECYGEEYVEGEGLREI